MIQRMLVRAVALIIIGMGALGPAAAQTYPSRLVKLGTSRHRQVPRQRSSFESIAERLSAAFGQPVIVENRPGGAAARSVRSDQRRMPTAIRFW